MRLILTVNAEVGLDEMATSLANWLRQIATEIEFGDTEGTGLECFWSVAKADESS